jgi:hypothetical protein
VTPSMGFLSSFARSAFRLLDDRLEICRVMFNRLPTFGDALPSISLLLTVPPPGLRRRKRAGDADARRGLGHVLRCRDGRGMGADSRLPSSHGERPRRVKRSAGILHSVAERMPTGGRADQHDAPLAERYVLAACGWKGEEGSVARSELAERDSATVKPCCPSRSPPIGTDLARGREIPVADEEPPDPRYTSAVPVLPACDRIADVEQLLAGRIGRASDERHASDSITRPQLV